ncbi:hypothetical protein NDU88_008949 [Pleurodeles waltl]|uniref:Uncharacterized protein n=1 Tax=Pleurodeles waltl TaxID=8319 RepID=A0AAV7PQT1_PLEWA|nr:hypothetical protein NDU88_008949 [Pleurodeles waltl]
MIAKNEDLEACSQHNNLRIRGIAETTEITRHDVFVENLLIELFGLQAFTETSVVKWLHRSLAPRSPIGVPPCPLTARLLNYRSRDMALRLACERSPVNYQESTLSFFPDFTKAVQDNWWKYADFKEYAQQTGLKYSIL